MVTPGPKYILPTTVGYDNHDVTRRRNPAYSILGKRFSRDTPATIVPGPKYACDKMSRNGIYQPTSAVVSGKLNELKVLAKHSPGPKYNPTLQSDGRYKSSPEAPFGVPFYNPSRKGATPGPKYMVPGVIGRDLMDLPNVPSWCMSGRTEFGSALGVPPYSPGPGKYGATDLDTTMRKPPGLIISGRKISDLPPGGIKPGPKYLGDISLIKPEAPSYSFGLRHSWKQELLRLPEDGGQYYGF